MSSCTKIDNTDRILMNLVYECYTNVHIVFLFGLAVPFIFCWLIFFPYLAYRSLKN
jgi:hypothetical protein